MLTGRPHQFSRSRMVSHISLPLGAAETDIQTWLTVVLSKVNYIKHLFKILRYITIQSMAQKDLTIPNGYRVL